MRSARISANTRWFGVVAVLALASSVASSLDRAPLTPPAVVNLSKLIPPMFPALSAQSVVTGSDNVACTNGDVNSGNQITVTLNRVSADQTGGGEVVIFNEARSVDLLGSSGTTVTDRFLENATISAGTFTGLNITPASQMTYVGVVTCTIGGQTRYYYSNGSSDPPSPFVTTSASGARAQSDFGPTTVTLFTGTSAVELPINFTVSPGATTELNIEFDPVLAVYDVGGGVYAVFPAASAQEVATP